MEKHVITWFHTFIKLLFDGIILLAYWIGVLWSIYILGGCLLVVLGFSSLLLQDVAPVLRIALAVAGVAQLLVRFWARKRDWRGAISPGLRGLLFLCGWVLALSGFGSFLLQWVSPAGKTGLGIAGFALLLFGIGILVCFVIIWAKGAEQLNAQEQTQAQHINPSTGPL